MVEILAKASPRSLESARCSSSPCGLRALHTRKPTPIRRREDSFSRVHRRNSGFYSPSDLISKITDGTVSRWLLRYTFSPQCSVVVYQLRYGTVGAQGEPTTASAALMVPSGSDVACQSPRPIVLYAHGKRNLTFFNIADLSGSDQL